MAYIKHTAFHKTLVDDANASTARATLGLTIGSDVQAYDAQLDSVAAWTAAQVTTLGNIGTVTTGANQLLYTSSADTFAAASITAAGLAILDDADAAAQRVTLGLAIGSDVQAYDADLAAIAALAQSDGNFIVSNGSAWVVESGATARASLGIASGISDGNFLAANAAVADNDFLRIDGTEVEGLTVAEVLAALNVEAGADVTDATNVTAAGALMDSEVTNLALVKALAKGIGDGNFLTANDAVADNDWLRIDGTEVEGRSDAEIKADLSLEIGTDVQAYDAQLADIAGLAVTNSGFIVGNGSNFVLETGNTLRTSMGVGTGDSPQFTGLTLTGDLTVQGTTTTVDVEVINTANGVLFEGATDDDYETTLKAVDPTGSDKTHQLANVSGYLIPFAAASTTAITATPAYINALPSMLAVGTKSASTNVASGENVLVCTAEITIGLWPGADWGATGEGVRYTVKNIHASDNVTVNAGAHNSNDKGDKLDGEANGTLTIVPGEAVTFVLYDVTTGTASWAAI